MQVTLGIDECLFDQSQLTQLAADGIHHLSKRLLERYRWDLMFMLVTRSRILLAVLNLMLLSSIQGGSNYCNRDDPILIV